ncbi:MAG: MBL fold metallo-hydrolase [Candidatus Omnitrophica bacterium]|nr:MBL fold metallo-hydrolase [Candidatus Omnitrophota bacterium]
MKINFLGTNGWYDTDTGNTLCILIETKKEYIILDAGGGFYKIGQYIKKKKPIYLFLSHFHLDHIIGLHTLLLGNFSQGIKLYGPPGVKKYLSQIVNYPYTAPISKLKTKVIVNQIKKEVRFPFKVEFGKLLHPSLCYGYRFNLEGKTIVYCTDTGICSNLYKLARDSDLFITECSATAGKKEKDWPHLTAQDAAKVAKKSQVKKLFLVHFNASLFKTEKQRNMAKAQAKEIFGNTFAASDGQVVNL